MKNSFLSFIILFATSVKLLAQPTITQQPASIVVTNGGRVNFSISVSYNYPLTYYLQFNGALMPGLGFSNTITYPGPIGLGYAWNATVTNIGNYTFVCSDNTGSITSSVATLNMPAFVTAQPQNLTALTGHAVTFNAAADGSQPVSYQWLFNGAAILNATNGSYSVNNVSTNDAGIYVAAVSNIYGGSVSFPVTLTAGYINQQLTNLVVATGGTSAITANVLIFGNGKFNYQWQLNGTNVPGAIITTVAGNGTNIDSGDGGAATNASLGSPIDVTVDMNGNLLIVDSPSRIRRVDTNGFITTVAGNGTNGYSGDGGAATNAKLFAPAGIAVDMAGNILIADTINNRIRKVDTNGIITTVAGRAGFGYFGDGGVATNASLNHPDGVAVDMAGNILIADTMNNRIRKVDTNGIITTVAGSSTVGGYSGDGGAATNAKLYFPYDITVDINDNILIADTYNNCIRKVDTNGIVTTVAGNGTNGYSGDGGSAVNAELNQPYWITVDKAGNLFIPDAVDNRIRQVNINGYISTVAGNGTNGYSGDGGLAVNASLSNPLGIAADTAGDLFIADRNNFRIREASAVIPSDLPALTLANISSTNAGNYTVIITDSTGPTGSVTDSVAFLTVLLPPQNFLISRVNGNQLNLQLTGTPNYPYILQMATNLTSPINWQPILTNSTDVNGNWGITVTNPRTVPAGFFRTIGQ